MTTRKSAGKSTDGLTPKERVFVAEYLKDRNGTRAAREAGYKNPHVQASQIMKRPRVRKLLMSAEKKVCTKAGLSAQMILERLAAVLNRDIADFLDDRGRLVNPKKLGKQYSSLIDAYEVEEYYDAEGTLHVKTKVKFPGIIPALDMAMKHKGLFAAEKHEHTVKREVDWEEMYRSQQAADPIQRRIEAAEQGKDFVPEDEPIDAEYTVKSLLEEEDGEEAPA